MRLINLLSVTMVLFSFGSCAVTRLKSSSMHFASNTVIAHRGAFKKNGFPENSIASLREAIRLGCTGSEFDVRMTADEVLVVNHDHDFQGMDIETSTYEQLLAKTLPNGEKIPTLKAYLTEGMTQKGTKLILEFKPSQLGIARSERVGELSVKTVQELGAQAWVEYITFSYEGGLKAIASDSKAKVVYLNGDKTPLQLKEAGFFVSQIHRRALPRDCIQTPEHSSYGVGRATLRGKLHDDVHQHPPPAQEIRDALHKNHGVEGPGVAVV